MRAREILREATANLASGTSRTITLLVSMLLLFLIGVAGSLVLTSSALALHAEYRDSGAATSIVRAPGAVDGAQCVALSDVEGVRGAMALREGEGMTFTALPSFAVPSFDVLGDPVGVLGGERTTLPGIVLPEASATQLGRGVGDTIALAEGQPLLAGVFAYPDDGRVPILANTVLVPETASGEAYDQCWVTIWPVDPRMESLLSSVFVAGSDAQRTAEINRVNASLGTPHPVPALIAASGALPLRAVAAVAAVILGAIWVRSRRLELALARHLRQGRWAQLSQVLIEGLLVCASVASVVASGTVVVVSAGRSSAETAMLVTETLSTTSGLTLCAALGIAAGAASIRASSFSDWAKDR